MYLSEGKIAGKGSLLAVNKEGIGILKEVAKHTAGPSRRPLDTIQVGESNHHGYIEATDGHRLVRFPIPFRPAREYFLCPQDLPAKSKVKVNEPWTLQLKERKNQWPDTSFLFSLKNYPYSIQLTFSSGVIKILRAIGAEKTAYVTLRGMSLWYKRGWDLPVNLHCLIAKENFKSRQGIYLNAAKLVDFFTFSRAVGFFSRQDSLWPVWVDYRDGESPLRFRPCDIPPENLQYILMPVRGYQ